ncbi:MAG: glycosyltransferase family 2 protein [Pseudonocardia sp.]
MSAPARLPADPAAGAPAPARLLRIAVVIVTYRSADQLDGCLDALRAGCAGVDLAEVVIADNASPDGTVEVARRPREVPVRVVQLGRNGGYAAGINAAVASLRPDVEAVLILNPDVTLRPGCVAPLAAALAAAPDRAVAAPLLLNPDATVQPSLRLAPTLARAGAEALLGGTRAARLGHGRLAELMTDPRHYVQARRVVWATGGALLLSTVAARDAGPWDESFLLYGEETEYALRLADRGWHLWFEPAAVMEHVGGTHTVTDPTLYALQVWNRVRLYRRRHGPVAGAAYHAVVTLGELLRAAGGRPSCRAALGMLLRPSRRLTALPG